MTTKTTEYYTVPQRRDTHIPTREEFHRYCSNVISLSDFCTEYPTPQIGKIVTAMKCNGHHIKLKGYKIGRV